LEKRGLVDRIRQREDRRIYLNTLTETGTELRKSVPDPIEKRLISHLADLKPEDVQLLETVVNQILNFMDAKGIEEAALEFGHVFAEDSHDNPKH
jgi:DNA-binding MarR family transcriptional regulator